MKRVFSILLATFMLISVMPFTVFAAETSDGICYTDYNDGVRIYAYHGKSAVVSIPSTIGGKAVLKLNTSAFGHRPNSEDPYLTSVTMPEDRKSVV